MLRNRIKAHRRVRAGDLVPHELNPRRHSDAQRAILEQIYQEIGFARSLLAFELPDGRLKLIDGHLRRDLTPDEVLDVEVLDVSEAEARALLLVLDPLAELARTDEEALTQLRQAVEADGLACQTLRQSLAAEEERLHQNLRAAADADDPPTSRYFILIFCADEAEQVALLERFRAEGLRCQAKIG
jgi:hypothetical protein